MFRGLVLAVIGGTSAVGLTAYKSVWESERDLSVIGNGKPTIVQIHDGSCPSCRELKGNVEVALQGMSDVLQYRVADIDTPEGRKLQRKYEVPHVTLLFFDKSGERKRTLSGVHDADELKKMFKAFAG